MTEPSRNAITVELMLQSSPSAPPAHLGWAVFPAAPVTPCGVVYRGDQYHALGQAWVVEGAIEPLPGGKDRQGQGAILQVLLRPLGPVQSNVGLVVPVAPGLVR